MHKPVFTAKTSLVIAQSAFHVPSRQDVYHCCTMLHGSGVFKAAFVRKKLAMHVLANRLSRLITSLMERSLVELGCGPTGFSYLENQCQTACSSPQSTP